MAPPDRKILEVFKLRGSKNAELESKLDPSIVMVELSFISTAPPPSENKLSLFKGTN
jgi:hypothetical protein